MNYDGLSVFAGALILFAIGFFLISILTFIYTAFAKNSHKLRAPKIFFGSAVVAFVWELITYLSVMLASSSGELVYGVVAGVLLFVTLYLVSHRFLEFESRDRIIYSLLLAIIVNPVWFSVLGFI